MTDSERGNLTRWRPDDAGGHLESYFIKANSPDLRRAFWIKYTFFVPGGRPDAGVAETWAIVFDRETHHHVAVKSTLPVRDVEVARERLHLRFGESELEPGRLRGRIVQPQGDAVAWDLRFTTDSAPLWALPSRRLYEMPIPKTKQLTPYPDERFDGTLTVNGQNLSITRWRGMQGHNWGREHHFRYAWVHCNVWDGDPEDTWFEGGSGRPKVGPFVTPWLSNIHLRVRGQQLAFTGVRQLLGTHVEVGQYYWRFRASDPNWTLEGRFEAERADVVGLYYPNPYGSTTHCLNSKQARGELVLRRAGGTEEARLSTPAGAALEIGTTATDHGARMYV